jgi:hypothetical protein
MFWGLPICHYLLISSLQWSTDLGRSIWYSWTLVLSLMWKLLFCSYVPHSKVDGKQDGIDDITTRVRAHKPSNHGLIHGRSMRIFLLQNINTVSWSVPAASYWVGPGTLPWEKSNLGVKLMTNLHLMPRSRISGAIPPPLSPITAWTGTNFSFYNL